MYKVKSPLFLFRCFVAGFWLLLLGFGLFLFARVEPCAQRMHRSACATVLVNESPAEASTEQKTPKPKPTNTKKQTARPATETQVGHAEVR